MKITKRKSEEKRTVIYNYGRSRPNQAVITPGWPVTDHTNVYIRT